MLSRRCEFGFSEKREILRVRDKGEKEMANDKVKCQCCGKMMVPRVVFSRGWYIGWGLRVGGGRPESNICPFCLSDRWHEAPREHESWHEAPREHKSLMFERICFAAVSFAVIFLAFLAANFLNESLYDGKISGSAFLAAGASGLFIAIIAYSYVFKGE